MKKKQASKKGGRRPGAGRPKGEPRKQVPVKTSKEILEKFAEICELRGESRRKVFDEWVEIAYEIEIKKK